MTLNLCLVFDLIFMIMYPFSQKEKFMNIYAVICLVFSVSMSASTTHSLMIGKTDHLTGFYALLFAYILMFVGGFGSIVFAYYRLSKPGISESARTLILKRHAISIIVFILTNLNIFVTVLYTTMKWTFPNPAVD